MIRQSVVVGLAVFTASMLAAPAYAEPAAPSDSVNKPAADPNERICEDISVGTRVGKKRFCGTRAEWEARKQQDREAVEQFQRPMQCPVMNKRC